MKFIHPYLFFPGTCAEALGFYAEALGGTVAFSMTHEGMPRQPGAPEGWETKILHASLDFGSFAIMASDAPPSSYSKPAGFYVSFSVDTPEEAERIYAELSKDAPTITMEIGETFWAKRFAMLTDRFGTPWMINCPKPMPQTA